MMLATLVYACVSSTFNAMVPTMLHGSCSVCNRVHVCNVPTPASTLYIQVAIVAGMIPKLEYQLLHRKKVKSPVIVILQPIRVCVLLPVHWEVMLVEWR